MKHKLLKNLVVSAATLLLISLPVLAADRGDVVVELKSQKVVKGADGKEKFESAESARPGEVIEYKASYRNKGKNTAANMMATIPVPLGMEYIPDSARPEKVLASVDGKVFGPVPLKRKVTLPSGQTETREVPYEEYRQIRWEIKSLAPGQSTSVKMQAKLSTTQQPSEAPTGK